MADVVRHVTITGKVQGVGYRRWAAGEAALCDLTGWIRNRSDGSVEALVAGAAADVAAFVAACRAGPRSARVAEVVAVPHDGPPPQGIKVLPTA